MTSKSKRLLTRRQFFAKGSATCVAAMLARTVRSQDLVEPHFFVEVLLPRGWDPTYLFDARPLAMTAAGEIQNYAQKEPDIWATANGVNAWVSPIAAPLKRFFPYFSVLNGVHMAVNFAGHIENRNFLLTGNPFGGELTLPHLKVGTQGTQLDFLQIGGLPGLTLSNSGLGIAIDPPTALTLAKSANNDPQAPVDPVEAFIHERLQAAAAIGQDPGLFGDGATALFSGLVKSHALENAMRGLALGGTGSNLQKSLELAHEYFRRNIVQSAVIVLEHNLDTHTISGAGNQPQIYDGVIRDLSEFLAFLVDTPIDGPGSRPMIECTSFVISSEFARTMRQRGQPVFETGTDHNPLGNMVIVGGRGFAGGRIIGETDRRSVGEPVTQAHATMDADGLMLMGKPFDFANLTPRSYQAGDFMNYDAADYLTYASVANSVYALFGADPSHYWKLKRDGAVAPVMQQLLR